MLDNDDEHKYWYTKEEGDPDEFPTTDRDADELSERWDDLTDFMPDHSIIDGLNVSESDNEYGVHYRRAERMLEIYGMLDIDKLNSIGEDLPRKFEFSLMFVMLQAKVKVLESVIATVKEKGVDVFEKKKDDQ